MTPVETHLESFGGYLNFMPKSFGQDARVPFGLDDFNPKGFSGGTDDLPNVRQRFLVHIPLVESPAEAMALVRGSQFALIQFVDRTSQTGYCGAYGWRD